MLDDYTRAVVNRAIEDALHPRGMSIHSGKTSIDAATLQRLIVMIDRGAEAILDAQERIAELERDAARYRWLADAEPFSARWQIVRMEWWRGKDGWEPIARDRLNAAIDAAMRKEDDDAARAALARTTDV